ncbi:hypothetical protein [Nonomuraea typhae]|uniref:hypothetical protein n=1 Tax=Nonomuraea typhae TaxID=2603600 RepID=UPI0012F9B219|nr:hypothetical protein [Nonomuraea typhae]
MVLLTAFGITALLGGLNTAPDKEPPKIAAGQKIDQGRFETEFVEAKVTVQKAADEFAQDRRYLDLLFKVTNKDSETTLTGSPPNSKGSGSGFAATLAKMTPEIKSDWGGLAFVPSGDAQSSQLHPGIAVPVTVRYELDKAAQAPAEVSLSLSKLEKVENPLSGQTTWLPVTDEDPIAGTRTVEVIATITAPVKQEPTS